jgi:hypothetical protein
MYREECVVILCLLNKEKSIIVGKIKYKAEKPIVLYLRYERADHNFRNL